MTDKSKMRAQAEAQHALSPGPTSPAEIQKALRESREHQVELERQNEELRAARAELDASRARYFDLYDLAPVAYVTVGEQGLILEANFASATLLGVARDALIQQPLARFILPDDLDVYDLHRKPLFETGAPQICEMRMVKADGTAFWAHLAAHAVKDAAGAPACRIVMTDVTARKQAEEALRLSQSCLAAIAENQPGLIWLKDRDGRFLSVNKEFAKSCGVMDPALLTGKSDLEIWPRELALRYIADDARVMETGESFTVEEPISDQGEVKWFETFKTPVRDEHGRVIGTTGYSRDVTARKRAEMDLKKSREFLDRVINAIADPVFVKDAQRRFVLVNDALCAMVGRPREELLGRDGDDMFPKEQVEVFRTMDAAVFDTGAENVNEEALSDLATGAVRTIVTRKTLYVDPEGKKLLVGIIRDATARKQAEEALRASQQIMESIIDTIPMRVFWKDKNLVYLGCNQTFARDAGFRNPKDLVGKDDFQMSWRQQAELYRSDDRQVLRHGQPKLFIEEPQTTPDGKTLTLLTSKIPLRSAEGEITGVLGMYMDITERKQAEEKLRATELRLREIAANLPGVVYQLTVNRNGFFEVPFMSAGCESLFGRSVAGMDFAALWFDQMPPDDLAGLRKTLAAAAKRMEPWSMEFRIVLSDGQTKWLRGSANPQQLPKGGIIWNGVLLDVTERKQAEEKAQQEQALNKAIIESIPGAFYMLDEAGNYLRWNAYQRDDIVGKPDDEMAGFPAIATIHPSDRALVQARIANVLATGTVETVEGRVLLRGGPAFRWLLLTGRQLMVENHPFLVGIGIDIAQRKQTEEQMAKHLDELRRWQAVTLGREGRVAELKREVNALAVRLGQPPPYPSAKEE